MVRSENFGDLIAMIVADDKQGVVQFLRSQGIAVSQTADVTDVVRTLFLSFKSNKFREKFTKWADNKYSKNSNFAGAYAKVSGDFDPMDSQSGGAELNFSTQPQAPADLGLQINQTLSQVNSTTGTKQTTVAGDTLRGLGGIQGIVDKGWQIFIGDREAKQQQKILDAQITAKKLDLEEKRQAGLLTQAQLDRELALLRAQGEAPQSQTLLYVIGGVVLLAGIGTAIYFATRKK